MAEHVAAAIENDPDGANRPRSVEQRDFVQAIRRQVFIGTGRHRRPKDRTWCGVSWRRDQKGRNAAGVERVQQRFHGHRVFYLSKTESI
jgi:hypothetical protein